MKRAPIEDLAALYCRVFTTDDGVRVLKDLTTKFGPARDRFDQLGPTQQHIPLCPLRAAIRDGQSSVLIDIAAAIELGRTFTPPVTPNTNTPP